MYKSNFIDHSVWKPHRFCAHSKPRGIPLMNLMRKNPILTSLIVGAAYTFLQSGCSNQGVPTEAIRVDQIPRGFYNAQKHVDEQEGNYAVLLDLVGGLKGELSEPLEENGRRSLKEVLKYFNKNDITNLLVERIKDKNGKTLGYLVGDVDGFLVYLNENKGQYTVKLESPLPESEGMHDEDNHRSIAH